MIVPVIPPTTEQQKAAEESPRTVGLIVLVLGLVMGGLLGTLVVVKKGITLGLMEMTIIGGIVAIMVALVILLIRPGEERKKKRGKHEHHT